MEIHISTSFLGSFTQNKFVVKVTDHQNTKEYKGTYSAGEWAFKLYDDEKLIIESQREKLSGKHTFLGRQRYRIFWEGDEIGVLNKSYLGKTIIADDEQYSLPRLFRPYISALKLKFPLSVWIGRRKVKSYCDATESGKIMLAIAITIFVWFTWNAIPAD